MPTEGDYAAVGVGGAGWTQYQYLNGQWEKTGEHSKQRKNLEKYAGTTFYDNKSEFDAYIASYTSAGTVTSYDDIYSGNYLESMEAEWIKKEFPEIEDADLPFIDMPDKEGEQYILDKYKLDMETLMNRQTSLIDSAQTQRQGVNYQKAERSSTSGFEDPGGVTKRFQTQLDDLTKSTKTGLTGISLERSGLETSMEYDIFKEREKEEEQFYSSIQGIGATKEPEEKDYWGDYKGWDWWQEKVMKKEKPE